MILNVVFKFKDDEINYIDKLIEISKTSSEKNKIITKIKNDVCYNC